MLEALLRNDASEQHEKIQEAYPKTLANTKYAPQLYYQHYSPAPNRNGMNDLAHLSSPHDDNRDIQHIN